MNANESTPLKDANNVTLSGIVIERNPNLETNATGFVGRVEHVYNVFKIPE